jgi:hypothetical protein
MIADTSVARCKTDLNAHAEFGVFETATVSDLVTSLHAFADALKQR